MRGRKCVVENTKKKMGEAAGYGGRRADGTIAFLVSGNAVLGASAVWAGRAGRCARHGEQKVTATVSAAVASNGRSKVPAIQTYNS